MPLETYMDLNGQLPLLVAPTHRTGSLFESLGSSISLQNDGLSASHLDVSSGNLSASVARMSHLNANSGPSVGSSSVVTDADSPLAGTAHLKRRGSASMDSFLNLPSSPLSFSSNFTASVIDASSIAQTTSSQKDQNSQQGQKRLLPQHLVSGTTTSQTSQTHRVSLPTGKKQEPAITQMYKKPRLDMNPENIMNQQVIQQPWQKQDPMQLQDHNQQLQAFMLQQKLRNQQQRQVLQSIPQFLGVPAQQQLMRHHLQQQANHQVSPIHPHDAGICSRRLMQYIYHLRHRPSDNSIAYWRKFVSEYYAPGAKKRWCLSLYDSIGEHALGVFSQAAMETWHCDICGCKSGKGFEAIFEILPRLSKIKFESGVIDELLFLDFPKECRIPSGLMMLSYEKAVQESVYEQFRVVREGQLRIIFSPDLKILSWEFCARSHDELIPRRLVAPQVNQLVQAAKNYQNSIKDGGSDGVSPQDLQLNCNMSLMKTQQKEEGFRRILRSTEMAQDRFLTAGRQLTGNLELLLVNDLGFSKRHVRCLQIAEVVNSMTDLMTFGCDNDIGPMESLRKYPQKETTTDNQTKQMHEIEWLATTEGLLTDKNKSIVVCPSLSTDMNENSCMPKDRIATGLEKATLAGMNSYQKLMKLNSNLSTVKREPLCSIDCSSQSAISSPFLRPQSSPISDLPTSQNSEVSEQRMIHKLLQEMVSNSRAKDVQHANRKVKEEVLQEFNQSAISKFSSRSRGTSSSGAAAAAANVLSGGVLARRDSSKGTCSSNSSSILYGNNTFARREPDIPEKFCLPEAVQEMDLEFFRNGVLNDDWNEMGWKA
ncbi:hypothetical protein TEA_002836 [Camellia sinensis var. sinensis]|uniref:Transcriptional regulator SLK2 n=1 Tax=Camellia sinensis var. sinensis TaxID=542762 RepID=A0A4V3WNX6_CAMSN|nr:hypothetical protein TEA_002836 [Camellia sinensis var. sinensis]